MPHRGDGPIPARVMIVGEAWGLEEERTGQPFMGASGQELNRMLHEAGILRSECFTTNVVNYRPPNNYLGAWVAFKKKDRTAAHVALRDRFVLPIVAAGYEQLMGEIAQVNPNLIIACGNLAMWALTGNWGILKWRGSMLQMENGIKVIPTIHPAAVLREWSNRALVVNDLRRAKREMVSKEYKRPARQYIIKPRFETVCHKLIDLYMMAEAGETWLDLDIETKAGHIACVGLSWSANEALCIPFMVTGVKEGYWSVEQEAAITLSLSKLLLHRNVHVRWQNGLYDAQYFWRHWHYVPGQQHEKCQDTMISQHSLFCALPKGLSFLASMYADHYVYWKDEGKNLDGKLTDERNWAYNCDDCVYTREVGEVLSKTLVAMRVAEVDAVQQKLFWPVLAAMKRGVRVRPEMKSQMAKEVDEALGDREAFLQKLLGHSINPRSSKQMQALLYSDLGQRPILKRTLVDGVTKMVPTCDDEALQKIANREPLLRPITNAIADIRTLGKFLNDFVLMKLDTDGRMRCSFNIAGDAAGKSAPYSYRLSSSESAFGSGGNLQTIPSEKSKSAGKAAARRKSGYGMDFELPNIRSMYGPDPGYTFFDMDLDRADLQVFGWEIDDKLLKQMLRDGVDMHLFHAYIIDGKEPPPLDELIETHPKYLDHRIPNKNAREFSKVFCHATDYVGSAKTVSEHTGRTIREIERAQRYYLGVHPNIEPYWRMVEEQLRKRRYVENKFGYRWHVFDRVEDLLPKAVAWIPQSTVGNVINRAWINIYDHAKEIEVLLQVHDSLAGQFPTHLKAQSVARLKELSSIVIPYDDPLIIPTGIKTSEISWGDCA